MARPKVATYAPSGTAAIKARGLHPLTVGLPPEAAQQLRIEAAAQQKSMSEVAAFAVSAYLAKRKRIS